MVGDKRVGLVFVHGINSGPAERRGMLARVEGFLAKFGARSLFDVVRVAQWRSLGDFVGDLEDLKRHAVRREEAVDDVAGAIIDVVSPVVGAAPARVVVVGHSMGQPLAAMALRKMKFLRRHPCDVFLITLGGPMGNGFARPYFDWMPQGLWHEKPSETLGVVEWRDVWNPDDPVCGGPTYRQFHASTSIRLDFPGHPSPLNLFSEHSSYFDARLTFDVLREVASRPVDSAPVAG